jgi:hypothetical protein
MCIMYLKKILKNKQKIEKGIQSSKKKVYTDREKKNQINN